jgi:uncharacterized MnhB-related membrane protein
METAITMGAAVLGGFVARSWYNAIVLGTILGVVARFGYIWMMTGSVARWEFNGAIVGTLLGSAVAALLVHLLLAWRRRRIQ